MTFHSGLLMDIVTNTPLDRHRKASYLELVHSLLKPYQQKPPMIFHKCPQHLLVRYRSVRSAENFLPMKNMVHCALHVSKSLPLRRQLKNLYNTSQGQDHYHIQVLIFSSAKPMDVVVMQQATVKDTVHCVLIKLTL